MLKKQFKFLISIMIIGILVASTSLCFATEATADDGIALISADEETNPNARESTDAISYDDENAVVDDEEATDEEATEDEATEDEEIDENTIIEEDVYHADMKDAIIKNPIDSNVFAVGKNVTVTNEVGNDVFVTANNFTLADTAIIYGNVFVCAQEVVINGTVYGNVYVVSEKLSVGSTSLLYKDVKACTKDVTIEGQIGRNVDLVSSTVNFPTAEDTLIYGKLTYTATNEINADVLKAVVAGETKFTPVSQPSKEAVAKTTASIILDKVVSIISTLLYVLVVALVAKKLTPKFAEYSNNMTVKSVLLKALFGLATLILVPVVAIILMVTRIGAAIGVMTLALYVLAIALAFPLSMMMVASFVNSKVKSDNKYIGIAVILGVTLIAKLLELIPFVGGLLTFIFLIVGLGMPVDYLTAKKSTPSTPDVKVEE